MRLPKLFKKKNNISNKTFGDIGEDIAESFLLAAKYTILHRNFRSKHGEIDIIARYKKTIAFIEVKTRSSSLFGLPEEAVNHKKQLRISQTARYYIYKNKLSDLNFRADIISVQTSSDPENPEIRHITDAFTII